MNRQEFVAKYKNMHFETQQLKDDLLKLWLSWCTCFIMLHKDLPELKQHIITNYPANTTRLAEYVYNFIHTNKTIPVCNVCGIQPVNFVSVSVGYFQFCSAKCKGASEHVKIKTKQTYDEKYNGKHPTQTQQTQEKKRQTCLTKYGDINVLGKNSPKFTERNNTMKRKYGVDHVSQIPEVKEKIKKACYEKYGVESNFNSIEINTRIKQTLIEKYGVVNPMQCDSIKEQAQQTCLKKYGALNPMQNEDIMLRSISQAFKKNKTYTFKNGDIVKVMGYEPFALAILEETYVRSDIVVGKGLPALFYFYENKQHRYYPDILLIPTNTIIEVKSEWTIKLNPQKQRLKAQSTLKAGFNFETWVISTSGDIIHQLSYDLRQLNELHPSQ